MPSGVYKHKTLKEEGIRTRSLGFRDGRLLTEIEQICRDPRIMNLAPENCRGRVYKTIWWGMKYLMKMVESRTIRREVPMFPDDEETAEIRRLRERIVELETIEAGNVQTIDDLTKQLNKKNTEIARLKQVDYTVKWDDISNDEEIAKILTSYNKWYSVTDPILGKKRTLDAKEMTLELFKELWKWHRLYQVVYADEHGELPTLEKMEELADKALMPKKKQS
jgi:hypothetical protein